MLLRKSISELKRLHHGPFFSRDTMKHWNSIVYRNVYTGVTGWYFVTSEQSYTPRLFTVRKMRPDGSIRRVGEKLETLRLALGEAKWLAENERAAHDE